MRMGSNPHSANGRYFACLVTFDHRPSGPCKWARYLQKKRNRENDIMVIYHGRGRMNAMNLNSVLISDKCMFYKQFFFM